MALTKYKLGDLIEESFRKNSSLEYGMEYVRGISNNKEIAQTKADVDVSVIHKFYIVNPCEFIYNPRTTRMGDKVGLAYNNTTTPLLFSFNNIAFYIKESAREIILPEYLYMYFRRPEFDRYAITNSWGSATELFSFDEMCDITLDLPSLDIQKKYVAIYNSLLANQKSYERGLDDLKLVCDAYIEDLRRKMPSEPIGPYVQERNEKNSSYSVTTALGISKEGFIPPKQDVGDLHNYWIFRKNDFVYSPPRINIGSIGLYKEDEPAVCSPIYVVFNVSDSNKMLPEYLDMWLHRDEFLRSTDFYSIASVRNNFSYELMEQVEIPIPNIDIQKAIVEIYETMNIRKNINERLKSQIKDICPILIKGSIEEGRKN